MIQQRWTWLLRNTDACFDNTSHNPQTRPCRICRLQERGEVHVPLSGLERHLALHSREKVVKPERVFMSGDEFLESLT